MLILLPAFIIIATVTLMIVMQRRDVGRGLVWSTATIGSVAAIIISLLLVSALPIEWIVRAKVASIYNRMPFSIILDETGWAFQTTLLAILTGVLLTATRRHAASNPSAWLGSLGITLVGLFAIQAGNLPTLLTAWFLIDTLELLVLLVSLKPSHDLGKLITSYALRYAGILLALISAFRPEGDASAGIYLLLAIMLRLGVLPFWPYWGDTRSMIGMGTVMLATRIISVLIPLARLLPDTIPSKWGDLITVYCMLLMFYCAVQWLRLKEGHEGRVYWISGYSLVACMCVIHDLASSGTIWGVTALLSGSALFLMTDRSRFYIAFPLLSLIAMTGLPYTPISSGWSGLLGAPVDWKALPFILAHVLLMAGYLRLVLRTEKPTGRLEGLAGIAYPIGLFLLAIMPWVILLIAGMKTPLLDWWAGFISFTVLLIIIMIFRVQLFESAELKLPRSGFWKKSNWLYERSLQALRQDWLVNLFRVIFEWLGRITKGITDILEGDGGVLWVFLLLALFASIIASKGGT